ncbi:protein IMPACT homolog [Saccostrea echinata]|uniref:protein IMPACT homolog n=1 Tax=Saccostrea echinata TaxID=191078 RepID=UPI002A7F6A76|nr:protein IMPACT homolog [Saccostrea echinata]
MPFPSANFGPLNPFSVPFAPCPEQITDPFKTLASLSQAVGDIKADLWEQDGFEDKIQFIAKQQEDSIAEIDSLKSENASLRKDIEMLKSVVIRLERRVTEQEKEIIDLKGRSMKNNILIHNLEEEEGEDLFSKIPRLLHENLEIEGIEFANIHRNAGDRRQGGKPRTITGRLVRFENKDRILKQQRKKKDEGVQLPFYITPQSPVQKEQQKLEEIEVKRSNTLSESGNQISAAAVEVETYAKVRNFYRKISMDPVYGRANHNILVYRFKDNSGTIHDGYCDDGEFGAGRKMLKILQDQNLTNVSVVISRMMGKHLGPKRFDIMEKALFDALKELL